MNYVLCKKLKEAGFPYKFHGGGVGANLYDNYMPSLSEIIEACGRRFYKLEHNEIEPGRYGWICFIHEQDYLELKLQGNHYVIGKSPTEAVANLWLAINKK